MARFAVGSVHIDTRYAHINTQWDPLLVCREHSRTHGFNTQHIERAHVWPRTCIRQCDTCEIHCSDTVFSVVCLGSIYPHTTVRVHHTLYHTDRSVFVRLLQSNHFLSLLLFTSLLLFCFFSLVRFVSAMEWKENNNNNDKQR